MHQRKAEAAILKAEKMELKETIIIFLLPYASKGTRFPGEMVSA